MTASKRRVLAIAMSVLLADSGNVLAESFDRGQALYENHCISCHDDGVHTRETRRATIIAELRKWVATWSFLAKAPAS